MHGCLTTGGLFYHQYAVLNIYLEENSGVPLIFFFPLDGKCVFPFYYRDGLFHDCVKFKAKHKWCSLNGTYRGYWKYCSEEDFARCVFPFWYRHLIYWECTSDGDAFGKMWCSLTQNYNKDKVWKYCD
uniref:Binder of sperm protein homolog 1 n=2 Tax=Sus scrofa TaxID=9823 RepID=A0A8D1BTG9_PIG